MDNWTRTLITETSDLDTGAVGRWEMNIDHASEAVFSLDSPALERQERDQAEKKLEALIDSLIPVIGAERRMELHDAVGDARASTELYLFSAIITGLQRAFGWDAGVLVIGRDEAAAPPAARAPLRPLTRRERVRVWVIIAGYVSMAAIGMALHQALTFIAHRPARAPRRQTDGR